MADYDSAVHSATTMKRKTIKRTGQLFFPIDINDIQSEVEISSESNHETPSLICANDTVSNVIPDPCQIFLFGVQAIGRFFANF